ncbi:MAG: BlaI/MecI/CopY family transcriptional regulator [Cyclobacteriaceae bacterium]|nr:BlaI/MecI/CopY family transcriptional regulator [Cyclobacteriaceae bacterium]
MKSLTRKEEEIMKILWDIKEGFVKDIIDQYPDPKPHYNTISSIVRLLDEKGIVGHKAFGNTYLYFPVLKKEDYRKTFMKDAIREYFDNSYKQTVSMFIDEQHLSKDDLDELINLIKSKKEEL